MYPFNSCTLQAALLQNADCNKRDQTACPEGTGWGTGEATWHIVHASPHQPLAHTLHDRT